MAAFAFSDSESERKSLQRLLLHGTIDGLVSSTMLALIVIPVARSILARAKDVNSH